MYGKLSLVSMCLLRAYSLLTVVEIIDAYKDRVKYFNVSKQRNSIV